MKLGTIAYVLILENEAHPHTPINEVSQLEVLLHKWLHMKWNFKIITELTFVGLQLYREGKKFISCGNNTSLHSRIESVNLVDDDYELVLSDSCAAANIDLNYTNVNQDLGQATEDSQFDSAQEGKPRCITHYFPRYYSSNYLYVL